MRLRSLSIVSLLVVAAACSGSDASPTSDDSPDTTVASTSTGTVGDDTTESTPPATEATPIPADSQPVESAPTSSDGLSSIDGPATVRPSCVSLAPGVSEFTLDAGGAVHEVRIFVPSVVATDPSPTVLNWHGLGSNGPEQAAFSGYETLAEAEGFIVVHATGVAVGGDGRNSWELSEFDTPDRDDLAFVDALIETVVDDWCADPDRIYSTGMSNGGFFTSELVCHRADKIAAAVSVAGTTHPDGCEPSRAVPYISFHGTADNVVPFDGSGESALTDVVDPDGFFGQVMPEEFAEFAADAGCAAEPVRTDETPDVVRYDYTGCDGDIPMTFYELPGSAHTWPDSPLAEQLASFGYFTSDISATADGWAFMSQFTL